MSVPRKIAPCLTSRQSQPLDKGLGSTFTGVETIALARFFQTCLEIALHVPIEAIRVGQISLADFDSLSVFLVSRMIGAPYIFPRFRLAMSC